MEIGDQFTVRTGFYGGTHQAVRDQFMREYAITNYGFEKFFDTSKVTAQENR